jgi:hypothetical protein
LYSCFLGGGLGIAYLPPIVNGFKHFPNSKGTITGGVLAVFGCGGFIFNKVGTAIFNPKGFSADPKTKLLPTEVTDDFALGLQKLSAIYLITVWLMAPLIRPPRKAVAATAGAATAPASFSVISALKTKAFWIMWFSIFMNVIGGLFVAAKFKTIALDYSILNDDVYLATAGAIGALSNGLFRLPWGMIYDRIGFRNCISVSATINVIIMACFPLFTSSRLMYGAFLLLSFMAMAGNFTVAPTESVKLFSSPAVYGAMFSTFALSGIYGNKITEFVADSISGMDSLDVESENVAFAFLSFSSFCALLLVQCHGRAWSLPRAQ